MNYTGDLLLDGEDIPLTETHEQHSGMRSVQNLEAIINEGLRVALLEETPDQSLGVLLEHLGKALNLLGATGKMFYTEVNSIPSNN